MHWFDEHAEINPETWRALMADGDQISKNFNRSEFACKCGCGFDNISFVLVNSLQALRDFFARPVRVTSGCRCVEHNAAVGGGEKSQHLHGLAADIKVDGMTAQEVYDWFERRGWLGGLGIYESWVHADVRQQQVRGTTGDAERPACL